MKDYMERINILQIHALIEEMRITKAERPCDANWIRVNGVLHIFHEGYIKKKPRIESIFTQYQILKIYNVEPSLYDQKRFQNFMISLYGEDYATDLKNFLKKQ